MSEQVLLFIAGAIVALVAYFVKNFILTPLMDFNAMRGRIHSILHFYANVFGNDIREDLERGAIREIRKISGDLEAAYYSIFCKKLLIGLHVLPSSCDIKEVSRLLIGLSNSTGVHADPREAYNTTISVRKILKLPEK